MKIVNIDSFFRIDRIAIQWTTNLPNYHSYDYTQTQTEPELFGMHIFTARKRSLRRLCFYRCVSVHRGGGGVGIPACLAGHMTRQQYISRCTVDVSQLVWRQQTGNIKCMMGYVTWYTPLGMETPPGMENPPDGGPPWDGDPPQMEGPPGWRTPLDGEPPQMEGPPGWRTPLGMENPPWMENPPRMENPPPWDGEPPGWRSPPWDGEPPHRIQKIYILTA